MEYMFYDCSSLTTLEVSGFRTDNVKSMAGMFYKCNKLASLDVSNFNTSNVTDMEWMFAYCEVLENLDVSGFDTSKVTDMGRMFLSCYSLQNLDVSGFDTSNVTNMELMFYGCSELTELDLSSFVTDNVENMHGMFAYCSSLTELDLGYFNMSKVTDAEDMISNCYSLITIYTPQNLGSDITLPTTEDEDGNEDIWYFSDGTVVTELPQNLSYSVAIGKNHTPTEKKKLTSEDVTVTLSESSYTYDGEAKKPTVTVKDSNGSEMSSDYYTVIYANNTEAGTATVTIRFKGEYTGIITQIFEITAPKQNDQKPTETTPTTGDDKTNTGTPTTDTSSGATGNDTTTGQGTGTTGTGTTTPITGSNTTTGQGTGTTGTDTTTSTTGSNTTTADTPQTAEKTELTSKNTTVKLAKSSYTYDGKAKKPTVTVKDSNGNTIDAKYYTVTYKNNKKVGKATVTITFKDSYTGTITATFKINPKATSLKKVASAKSKTVKVTWKKQTKQTTGYEVQYATSKNFAKKTTKTATVKSAKTTSTTIKKLTAKKKYFVRIRTYKTVNGKKYYSAWSKVQSAKTK
jgi:surface protein